MVAIIVFFMFVLLIAIGMVVSIYLYRNNGFAPEPETPESLDDLLFDVEM